MVLESFCVRLLGKSLRCNGLAVYTFLPLVGAILYVRSAALFSFVNASVARVCACVCVCMHACVCVKNITSESK